MTANSIQGEKMFNIKKPLKIVLISVLSLIAVLLITIILLLVFFPSELARKEIEKQASKFLQTEVKLEKLKFSIFNGFELRELSVKQFDGRWKDQYILKLNKAYLKYNLLPILFKRELSIKGCVIESGVINLERTRRGANWDHFINIFNAKEKDSTISKKDSKKKDKDENIVKSFPIDIDLKKIGVQDISLNYTDTSFFDIPLLVNLKDVTLLAKNIRLKNNKPFDLTSKVSIGVNGGEYISLSSFVKSSGKLKIFDDQSNEFFLNGPIKIDLIKANFASKLLKELIVEFIGDLIGNIIGPELKGFLSDKNFILKESNIHFDNILNNSKGIINKEIERAGTIVEKKKDFIEYKSEVLNDFEKQQKSPLTEIDSKIDAIDDRVSPILDNASRIPFVEKFVNLSGYKNEIKKLRNKSNDRRNNLKNKYQGNLDKELLTVINNAVPNRIPSYKEYENEFFSRVDSLKGNLTKNISNFSVSSFVDSYIPDLTFIDKGFEILGLSTIYYLNKVESKTKNFKFKSNFLNIDGDFKNKKREIDFIGDFDINNDFLKIGFLPNKDLKAKIQVFGDLKDLRIKILEFPKLKIDADKLREASVSIVQSFLNKNYSDNVVISQVLNKFQIMDINEKELKNKLLDIKNLNFEKMISEKNELVKSIDKDTGKIIDELRNRIPGL